MKLIVQHNYTSGHGDALMGMIDFMNVVNDLKKIGFKTHLKISLSRNYYFKEKTPLDYVNIDCLDMFDVIEVTNNIFTEMNEEGYTCVFTHSNAKPSQHYWDLFIDNDSVGFFYNNYKIKQYDMNGLVNGNLPLLYPKLNSEIINNYEKIRTEKEIDSYDAIYFRTQDLLDELDFLEENKEKIIQIVNNSTKLFFCSNSVEFKKFVKSLDIDKNKLFYWELPLEEKIGGNHLEHYKLDSDVLHSRSIYTFLDMWTLGNAKKIHFFTTWGRLSNFLIYVPLNKNTIIKY